MKQPRFLFLLYHYPPVAGIAGKRNGFISCGIAPRTDHSYVFTASGTTNTAGLPENMTLQKIPSRDYRKLLHGSGNAIGVAEQRKKTGLVQWLVRLINSFPFSILIGEGGLVYYIHLLRKGQKLIRQEGITHIYSSFRPFADHYAAYTLKKRNPHLVWIADFRDLIIDPHFRHILFPKAHHAFFKNIFSKADLLTTVSDGLAAHLISYNPNVITVRNGITGEIAPPQPSPQPYFNIVYTGSMFLDKRNARPLFIAVSELIKADRIKSGNIRIIYAGKDSAWWQDMAAEYGLASILDDRGIVSGEEAIALQQSACINLLLTISSDELQGYLTGKMIEYFQAGSPVLGIVHGQNDPELTRLLHELSIGDSWSDQPPDLPAIREFIIKEYMHWQSSGANRKPVDVALLYSQYARDAVLKELMKTVVP